MAQITASLVKELRERTGSGMMECKKALLENDGDIEKAIEAMRKSGQAKAVKKASRTAADGVVLVEMSDDAKKAVIVEVNCETDFVARDESFLAFSHDVAKLMLAQDVSDVAVLAEMTLASGETVETTRQALVAKIGENINVRRAQLISTDGTLGAYIHGGRIGVLTEVTGDNSGLAKDIAMHVAATNPLVVSQDDVPQAEVDKEKEIFVAQARESGKPDEIIEKMVTGRLRKFLDEVSLLGQDFVKDPSMKVQKLLKDANAEVKQFVRFGVGEGIEKEETDFVKEVMEQARGAA